jgi:pilus assembly protein Flp/PilA
MLRFYVEVSRVYAAAKKRLEREEGQAMVEYALILALISVVAIAVLQAIGFSITDLFNKVSTALSGVAT